MFRYYFKMRSITYNISTPSQFYGIMMRKCMAMT